VILTGTKKLACGVWPLIEYGICRYIEAQGRKPAAVVLHPAQVAELDRQTRSDPDLLMGVSIVVYPFFGLPVLYHDLARHLSNVSDSLLVKEYCLWLCGGKSFPRARLKNPCAPRV